LFVFGCNGGEKAQQFVYDTTTKTISNNKTDWGPQYSRFATIQPNKAMMAATKKCLTSTVSSADPTTFGTPPLFQECKEGDQSQQWNFDATKGTISPVNQLLATLCLDYATTWQCDQQDSLIARYPFCNHALTSEQRANDIVARMTPEEKIAQMLSVSPAIPRLGIPRYDWWSEALHGVLSSQDVVTMFPQVIGLGATFNQTLYKTIGQIISTEARALANQGIQGLSYWAPNINIFRDPRWGRGQETPGEDPFLSGRYAARYVSGMQEGDSKFAKVVATCKHFAAYSLENWNHIERYAFDAKVDQQDLDETYLPAFKACVTEGKARSIMCSYNAVNGVPACASEYLLKQTLRDSWGFNGYVVSDCDAIANVYNPHHYTNTTWAASAVSVRAGTDLDCGGFYGNLMEAINHGAITDTDLNTAVVRLYTQRFELGMFDRASNPFEKIEMSAINTPASQEVSLMAARESIVLLKNHQNFLPLDKTKIKNIAVIGPNANEARVLWGNYEGLPPYTITHLAGIQKAFQGNVTYAKGCHVKGEDKSGFPDAIKAASAADVVVLVVGIDQSVESEGLDRYNITLPGVQNDLAVAVMTASKNPIIVVLVNGGPLDITYLRDSPRVGAIVEAWYGGQSAGTALADVLFGVYNPGGVLPVTFYPANYVNMTPLTDMNMRPFPGRTYRYLQIDPVWRFGFGLSYTSFAVAFEDGNSEMQLNRPVNSELRVIVKNIGDRDGDYVALAFAKSSSDDYTSPHGALFAFERVHVKAGQATMVKLPITNDSFARFRDNKMTTHADNFVVTVTGTQNSNTIERMVRVI
jgi:beta-D-xylosidase 4